MAWSLDAADPADMSLSVEDVDAILDHVFMDGAAQSTLIVKNGYIIGERYADGFGPDSTGTSWSVAKSLYSAAIGIAIEEGWITSLEQRASDFLIEWQGTSKSAITIRNLLEMRAGLEQSTDIFFSEDHTSYAIDVNLVNTPGSAFLYSNPTSQLFEPILLRATGMTAHEYLLEKVIRPIGVEVERVGLWFDRTGLNPMTYCGIDMRPKDFARFGVLYARGGEWNGVQIIEEPYVQQSLSPASGHYGFQWWVLNSDYFGSAVDVTIHAALGGDGQRIYVWPEEDVVVVVLSRYEHFTSQGYVLSDANFPNTCAARNTCPDSDGQPVGSYDELGLVRLIARLSTN